MPEGRYTRAARNLQWIYAYNTCKEGWTVDLFKPLCEHHRSRQLSTRTSKAELLESRLQFLLVGRGRGRGRERSKDIV